MWDRLQPLSALARDPNLIYNAETERWEMDMEAFAAMTPEQQELYQYNYNQMLNGMEGFGLDAVSDSMKDLDIVATGHLSYEATVTNAILERDSTLTIAAKHDFTAIYPR